MIDPPDIPEPEFTPHSVPAPESSVRPGIDAPQHDPNTFASIDYGEARELVAKARHIHRLTLRNALDPAWREVRSRIVDLRAAIRHNQDEESKYLVHEINELLGIHH